MGVRAASALWFTAAILASATVGCSAAGASDVQAGDCLHVSGPPERPETAEVACGSPESAFKVIATVESADQCPTDVDSSYRTSSSFDGSGSTMCLDVDWVVGGCTSIDPEHLRDPVRVDCGDAAAPNRQRATQIMRGVANVDQCGTGLGYAYPQRDFTVCVEYVP